MIEEPELYRTRPNAAFPTLLTNLSSTSAGIRVPRHYPLSGLHFARRHRSYPDSSARARSGRRPGARSPLFAGRILPPYSEVIEKPVDDQKLFRQFHVVDAIVREAFFANAVVLVEGSGDHGLLAARCADEGIEREGRRSHGDGV